MDTTESEYKSPRSGIQLFPRNVPLGFLGSPQTDYLSFGQVPPPRKDVFYSRQELPYRLFGA